MFVLVQKFRLSLPTFSLFNGISSQCTYFKFWYVGFSYFHSLGCSLSFKVCTKIAHNS